MIVMGFAIALLAALLYGAAAVVVLLGCILLRRHAHRARWYPRARDALQSVLVGLTLYPLTFFLVYVPFHFVDPSGATTATKPRMIEDPGSAHQAALSIAFCSAAVFGIAQVVRSRRTNPDAHTPI